MMQLQRPSNYVAPAEEIKIHSSYNLAAMSFTTEIAAEIKNTFQNSRLLMNRTSAKKLDSWPASIDDHQAREDWGWNHI
jgi:hypothetical protein